jgi:hypothetical protein
VSSGESTPPVLRASDAERERTATLLREHTGAGRLTPEELSERLDAAYAARTVTELDELVHDLPPAAAPAPAAGSPARERAMRRVLHAVGIAVLVNLVCAGIWLASGADGSFWPKWVLVVSAVRLAFTAWAQLGPGAEHDEAQLGRGGALPAEHARRAALRRSDRR